MEAELFILELAECEECQKIMYMRMAIRESMGFYYSKIIRRKIADPFTISFRNYVKERIKSDNVDIDELYKYMLSSDKPTWTLYLATLLFAPKKGLSFLEFGSDIAEYECLTPYVDEVDMDSFSLIVVSFVLDNFYPRTLDIREIVKGKTFKYPTNQYGLTKINGAVFKRDGLIFKGRGYYYNLFTDKETLLMCDSMAGFARLIQDETKGCDILYRLDERLSMPEQDYFDYASDSFARFYGPRFNFDGTNLDTKKTIIVHIDESTQAKLLMVIKKCIDQNTNTDFWHIEIETLPYYEKRTYPVITTFLHGMYYPINKIFTHIDYTKNQYSAGEYSQKYADSVDGMSIDHYTSCRDLHYKIWCIENGQFSRETWYKLMMVSLPKIYQNLLNEILN